MVTRLDRLARSTRDLLNTLAADHRQESRFKSVAVSDLYVANETKRWKISAAAIM
jgi:DNA invertase Pin-like site-specific DNA recombinase